jgi:hypothetical protein
MGAGKMAITMKINGFGGVYGLNEDYELGAGREEKLSAGGCQHERQRGVLTCMIRRSWEIVRLGQKTVNPICPFAASTRL